MKKLFTILFVILLFSGSNSFAQGGNKFGHIDFAKLYSMMPGLDSVKKVFDDYNKSVQEQYAAMQTELENKFMDYQANAEGMSAIIRQTKEAEINDLRERLDAFETQATQDLQSKEAELTSPIIEMAKKAVEDVAKESGYTYIFNSTEGLLLYAKPSDDIMDLVKAKLKITKSTP
ncbi:MAG: OmpH family outer membrane protein [Bacteroidales bacterium]|nr:OmpH family outer membrane protein [Bacteroidales bacterium]